jgi:phosphopantothenoylcysteine decarboxylase/phosphopantothenate--cysteine ligase
MTVAPKKGKRIFVGFAAETGNLRAEALRKLKQKNLDLIIANDICCPGAGFETDTNRVVLFSAGGEQEALPLMSKINVAERIIKWIEAKQPRQHRACRANMRRIPAQCRP